MSEHFVDNDRDHGDPKRKWRKKRKNFLSNAKKYAKKGQMGRGTKMSEELYQYFVGILDAIKSGLKDEDERQSLVTNVLERTKGDEVNIVSNQLGSRIIELLLPYALPEDFERFTEAIDPHLRKMASDNFTSHVIETLLRVSCYRATLYLQEVEEDYEVPHKKSKTEDSQKYPQVHVTKCYQYTIKMSKYVLNNLEDFVWDPYANHILRSALKCLSGIILLPGEKPKMNNMDIKNVDSNKGIPPHTTKLKYRVVPEEFKELVREFATRLISWPQFKELPFKNVTSALLQVLLYATKNVDKHLTKDLVKKLLNEAFAPDNWVSSTVDDDKKDKIDVDSKEGTRKEQGGLPPVFESQPAVRLLEAALFVAKKKTYTQIYARCFINRLARLATVPMLNFTVQRLFDNCAVREEFEPMFEELCPKLDVVLAAGNSGVLVAMAKACLRLSTKQAHFLSALEKALACSNVEQQKYLSVACLRLTPLDKLDTTALNKEYFIHVHGSVILQCAMDFQRPGKIVNSLLELDGDQLLVILCDAKGSHLADAFCTGQHVGVKARDKLIWKMKGYYQKMALSQYGSRAFEKIFQAASAEQKIKIMTELADKSSLLNGTQYGKLIADKLDVPGFKISQKNWEENQEKKKSKNEEKKE